MTESADRETRTAFLLALLDIEGIGRAAASRIFTSFDSFQDVARYPEEQIASRLKRIPRALDLARKLKDISTNEELLSARKTHLESLASKDISIITRDDSVWPQDLDSLKPSAAPAFLYLYGNKALFDAPRVSYNAANADALASPLAKEIGGILASRGASVVMLDSQVSLPDATLAGAPVILLIGSGLGGMTDEARATANAVVKAGGLLVSPFDFSHEAYSHETEYLRDIANHIADAAIFFSVPYENSLFDGMLKLTGEHRPIFAVDIDADIPEGIHPVQNVDDAWWIAAALNIAE